MSLRRALAALLVLGALSSIGTTISGATFTATTRNPGNSFTAAADWVAPTVTATVPAVPLHGSVTVSATAADASPIVSVRLQSSPAGAGAWADICTDTSSPYTCAADTTAVPDGRYDVRAIAVDGAGNTGISPVVADNLVDNTAPQLELDDLDGVVRGTVTVTAIADDATGSGVASVRIQRSPVDAGSWTDLCADVTPPYSCALNTTALANDTFDLRAAATDVAGNTATSEVETVQVDNVAPAVTLTNPGSPLSGTVTLAATASDADSSVDTVTIQRATAGGSTWTDICVIASSPWTCAFVTTAVAGGLYDLRAIAVDAAGNTRTSATVTNRRVDNTVSSISLVDPGSPLRATVTLNANASSAGTIASVAIQRSPAGAATWTTICTDTTTPYSCSLNTAAGATPDGAYDLRAVMTTGTGVVLTSAIVANRVIDNTAVRGTNIQTTNKSGGTAGRMEAGDTIVLTYSEAMKASTLISGWSGSGSASLYVRTSDAILSETTRFTTDAAGNSATGLGTFTTGGNYVNTLSTVVFAATATVSTPAGSGSVVTVTLGAVTSGSSSLHTQSQSTTVRWTPAAAATDLAGNACSTSVVTESGAADRDF